VNEDHYRGAERSLWATQGVTPTERFITLQRTDTSIRVQEVGAGPAVIFVHGASNGGTSWASLASRLSDFRCILIDRPGCGLSHRLRTDFADMDSLGAFADDLVVDVLDAMEVTHASVVGTSLGGYYAIRTAAAHPERVDRLVTLSWSFGAPAANAPLVMRIANQPRLGRLALKVPVNERMARSMLKQIGLRRALETGAFGPVEMAWFLALLRDTDTMRNEIEAAPRITTLRGFNETTLLVPSVLERVTCPSYFLWGEEDPMGGADIARRFVAQFPDATLELMAEAGHAPWMDAPDEVAARVGSFLRS
jgi:2-hydroxy-6-oxonona-2,4-dienedioate hydrolase